MYDYSRRTANYGPLILGVLLVLFLAVVVQMVRGAPDPEYTVTFPTSSPLGEPRQPLLPADGASIIAVTGLGVLGSAGDTGPRPIASITKMMTAYVILKDHPLAPGETGPVIELTAANEARWLEMVAQDQSSLPVYAGQRLTELQLLQGLLVPSANNYAEILAEWDAGSVPAFVEKMNAEAAALGMLDTTYTDTSGFSPETLSTAADQLIVGPRRDAGPRICFDRPARADHNSRRRHGFIASTSCSESTASSGSRRASLSKPAAIFAFAAIRDAAGQQVDVYGIILGQGDGIDAFESRKVAFDAAQTAIADLDNGVEYPSRPFQPPAHGNRHHGLGRRGRPRHHRGRQSR